jgi:hypothetical protein
MTKASYKPPRIMGDGYRGTLSDCLGSTGLHFNSVSDIWQARLDEVDVDGPGKICGGTFTAYSGIVIADDGKTFKVIPDLNQLGELDAGRSIDGLTMMMDYRRIRQKAIPYNAQIDDFMRKRGLTAEEVRRSAIEQALVLDRDLRMNYYWDVHVMHCPITDKEEETIRIPINIRPYRPGRIMLEMHDMAETSGVFGYMHLVTVGPVADDHPWNHIGSPTKVIFSQCHGAGQHQHQPAYILIARF